MPGPSRFWTAMIAGLASWHATETALPQDFGPGVEGIPVAAADGIETDVPSDLPINWDLPTMGGTQFWTDLAHRSGWRIQRNSLTGHCRLLDGDNIRRAWGSEEQCRTELMRLASLLQIPVNQPTVVILAHGLARTRGCWDPMKRAIAEKTGWQVIDFTYASTRKPMADHAAALRQLIEGLGPEVTTIHLAGHSMGNIVIRHYLGDTTDPATGRQGDPRIGRIVMIAPPNQGSRVARVLQPTGVFSLTTGRSGVELGRDWKDLEPRLAVPAGEFGIIAGGKTDGGSGFHPVFRGPNDLTVSVEETKLAGAGDFLVQPWLHPTIMKQPDVVAATVRFLETGGFREAGERQPIVAEKAGGVP